MEKKKKEWKKNTQNLFTWQCINVVWYTHSCIYSCAFICKFSCQLYARIINLANETWGFWIHIFFYSFSHPSFYLLIPPLSLSLSYSGTSLSVSTTNKKKLGKVYWGIPFLISAIIATCLIPPSSFPCSQIFFFYIQKCNETKLLEFTT